MKTSPVPFATLLAGLDDPDSRVRLQVISGIVRRRSARGQAFASLLVLLNDPDWQIRLLR